MPKPMSWMVAGTLAVLGVAVADAGERQAPSPPGAPQTCIALVLPSVKGATDAGDFAASLRDLFASYLSGPSLRTITVDARLASQAIEEVKQKDCGYVLLTSIEQKRSGGGGLGRLLGRAATGAAWYVPYGGTAAAATTRGAAVAGAYAVSSMAESTKAKDEVTLEFRIGTPATVMRASPMREKAKAENDGEDLLTPIVEKASEAIAAAVLKR